MSRGQELKKSNIKQIIIGVENLTDEEQLKLWINLWNFADKELPPSKDMFCYISKGSKKCP